MRRITEEPFEPKRLKAIGWLVLTMLTLILTIPVYGEVSVTKTQVSFVSSNELRPKGEVIGRRTINSKTTLLEVLPDGRKRYAVDTSMGPIHYKDNLSDPNEAWKDIDTTIRPSDDAEYQFINRENFFESHFKNNARAKDAVRYQIGKDFITYTLKDNELGPLQDVVGYPERNMFIYPRAYPGVDVKYSVQSVRLLEEFVLHSYKPVERISQEISFEGAYFEEREDGSYAFYDTETHEELWIIPQPLMYELDDPAVRSYGIHYELYANGDSTFTLVKVLDEQGKAWLSDEARNFPVAIDATLDKGIVTGSDDADHWQAYNALMMFGGVGTPKPNNCGQGFRFQTIPLSQGDTVTSAYLSIVNNQDYWITIDVRLTAIDLDNVATFSGADPPGNRPITLSYIAVDSPDIQRSAGERVNYPTTAGQQQVLGAAINYVINRPGWQSGNAIAVVNNSYQDPNASTTWNRWFYRTYDYGSPEVHGPKLHLEYTTASGDEYTYYFDGYSASEFWNNAPNMTNGDIGTHAWTNGDGSTQHLTSNTCPGTDLGTITKVELRVHGGVAWGGHDDDILLRPVFGGVSDGPDHLVDMIDYNTYGKDWSVWVDITTDTNAPGTWAWNDVVTLDCDVVHKQVNTLDWMLAGKVEIRVTCGAPVNYTITAVSGPGGSITPSGSVVVDAGSDTEFTITPNTGYVVSDVQVDGSSVGAVTSYTFFDVSANHDITASFNAVPTYTITVTQASGGIISPGGTVTVTEGDDKAFSITADTGYSVADVIVDGVSVGAATSYTLINITADHTITAVFEVAPTYTITASAGNYGSIAPEGDVVVNEGDDQEFTITPDSGYAVQDVLVDGLSVGAVTTYTFSNVTADHTIDALFIEGGIYTIIAVAGNGGSISPEGTITVAAGGSQAFTISPDAGNSVLDVEVDGSSVGAVTTYNFSSVSSGHVIVASFDISYDECVDLSSVPLGTLIHAAPPNLMILLDDSGSMDGEILTDQDDQGTFLADNITHWYMFVDPGDHTMGDGDQSVLFGEQRKYWKAQWSGYNRMYYNPGIDYGPWPGFTDADRDNPRSHPYYDENYFNLNATYWVPGEIAIDELDSSFSRSWNWTQRWSSEAFRDRYFETTTIGEQHEATWDPDPNLTPGWYNIYVRWRDTSSYSASVKYIVYHDDDPGDEQAVTDTVYVSQRTNGTQWNLLGSTSYWFGGHDANKVKLVHTPSDSSNHACADAVRFVPSTGVEVKRAHYYTYEDTNTNDQYDAGEPVYLVVIDGDAGSYSITYYLATIGGSSDYEEVTDLTEVSAGSVPASVKSGRTASEERQNFANWFSYHRRRWMAATEAVAHLILNMQGVQIGFHSIQQNTIQPVLKVKVEGVDQTDQLLDIIFSKRSWNGSTPLRRGLEAVGRYFHQNDSEDGGIGESPFATAENGGECQQAFAIVMTDGYWNGGDPLNATEIQNVDGDNGVPYADTYAQTLADVAMYYYENDLSSSLDNKVPVNPADDATHQHMVTYTVAFGITGNLNPDDYNLETGPYPTWPDVDAEYNGPSRIDDLWHAAVNGRGSFLSARDPEELVGSLRDIMQSIESRIASSASISVNGDQLYGMVGANILMFQSTYNPDGWSGDVKSYQVDNDTGNVITTSYIWSAADELDSLTWTSRRIATCDTSGDNGRAFEWDLLDSSQQAHLNDDEAILNFLRGDRSNEMQYGGTLRNRYTALGDIVHSSAIFENEFLYVGSNDGMLHCFNASTGVEQFAYVPNLVFDKLADLAEPLYGISHQYYVDRSPTVQPGVDIGGNVITLLVGGLGGGGTGYYALNVTDPSTMTSAPQVANKVMWEFSGESDLGFTYPRATIAETNDDDVNKNSTAWIVITGNGYNSQNGKAVLFILDPIDGSVIKKIDVGNGPCNGLSTPAAVDADSDGTVDYVYAGDLKGNLWKFDLTDTNEGNWDVAYKDGGTPKPLFRCPGQPITTQPDVMVHCEKHGYMVVFGTGKYLEPGDPADTGLQSIYGVWDYGDDDDISEYLGTFIRGAVPQLSNQPGTITLLRQTIVPSTEADPNFWTLGDNKLRVFTDNAPDWTTTSELADHTCGEGLGEAGCDPNGVGANPDPLRNAGWYFDLPISREKMISDVVIRGEKVIVISFVSEDDPCGSGGDSIIHEIDACSGGRLATPQFDIDNSGNIGSGDLINIGTAENPIWVAPTGVNREGRLQPPAILRLTNPKDEEMKYYSSSTGEIRQEQGPSVGLGISHWREYR